MLSVAVPHPNIQCDKCLQHIAGRRFKCVNCADYDCCEACLIADPLYAHYFSKSQLLSRPVALPNPGAVPSDANPAHSPHTHLFLAVHAPLPPAVSHNPLFWNRPTHYLTATNQPVATTAATTTTAAPVSAAKNNALPVHAAMCDGCNDPIVGIRYKCSVCADFDFCSSCYRDSHVASNAAKHGRHSASARDDGVSHPPDHLFYVCFFPLPSPELRGCMRLPVLYDPDRVDAWVVEAAVARQNQSEQPQRRQPQLRPDSANSAGGRTFVLPRAAPSPKPDNNNNSFSIRIDMPTEERANSSSAGRGRGRDVTPVPIASASATTRASGWNASTQTTRGGASFASPIAGTAARGRNMSPSGAAPSIVVSAVTGTGRGGSSGSGSGRGASSPVPPSAAPPIRNSYSSIYQSTGQHNAGSLRAAAVGSAFATPVKATTTTAALNITTERRPMPVAVTTAVGSPPQTHFRSGSKSQALVPPAPAIELQSAAAALDAANAVVFRVNPDLPPVHDPRTPPKAWNQLIGAAETAAAAAGNSGDQKDSNANATGDDSRVRIRRFVPGPAEAGGDGTAIGRIERQSFGSWAWPDARLAATAAEPDHGMFVCTVQAPNPRYQSAEQIHRRLEAAWERNSITARQRRANESTHSTESIVEEWSDVSDASGDAANDMAAANDIGLDEKETTDLVTGYVMYSIEPADPIDASTVQTGVAGGGEGDAAAAEADRLRLAARKLKIDAAAAATINGSVPMSDAGDANASANAAFGVDLDNGMGMDRLQLSADEKSRPKAKAAKMLHVMSIAVDADWRGHKLGERLMKRSIEVAQSMTAAGDGVTYVMLHVRSDNPVAYRLYVKLGFITVRRVVGYYHRRCDGIRMILRVANPPAEESRK